MEEKIAGFFYLKIFVVIFLFVIVIAVSLRFLVVVTNSKFTQNSFSILYVSNDSKILFVDKKANSAVFLAVGDIKKIVSGRTPIEASLILGVPLNGIIIDNNAPQNIDSLTKLNFELGLLFGDSSRFKGLDEFDVYRFINFLRGVPSENRTEMRLNIKDFAGFSKKTDGLFKDSSIINASYTVEIDNGTTINGLGNDLASILTSEGYNVISVRTATTGTNSDSYIAFPNSLNDYIESLHALTGFPVKREKLSQTSDVTIYLGQDLDADLSQ